MRVTNCPIHIDFCFTSCFFWRQDRCQHKEVMAEIEQHGAAGLTAQQLKEKYERVFAPK